MQDESMVSRDVSTTLDFSPTIDSVVDKATDASTPAKSATVTTGDEKVNSAVKPSAKVHAVRYAELRPNGTFPLDEQLSYDRLPAVKAYLMLLGTEERNQFAWYQPKHADEAIDPDDEDTRERKRLTDEAVRRGVRVLNASWKEGRGVFIDSDAPAMDGPMPWLRATGLISGKWFQDIPDAMRPGPKGEAPNWVNCDLWHGNVYVPLYDWEHDGALFMRMRQAFNEERDADLPWGPNAVPWGTKIARIEEDWKRKCDAQRAACPDTEDGYSHRVDPTSMEFPFFIHYHYGKYHVLDYLDDAWSMPGELDDRAARPWIKTRYGRREFDISSWEMQGSFVEYVLWWRDDDIRGRVLSVDTDLEYMESGRAICGHWLSDFESDDESDGESS